MNCLKFVLDTTHETAKTMIQRAIGMFGMTSYSPDWKKYVKQAFRRHILDEFRRTKNSTLHELTYDSIEPLVPRPPRDTVPHCLVPVYILTEDNLGSLVKEIDEGVVFDPIKLKKACYMAYAPNEDKCSNDSASVANTERAIHLALGTSVPLFLYVRMGALLAYRPIKDHEFVMLSQRYKRETTITPVCVFSTPENEHTGVKRNEDMAKLAVWSTPRTAKGMMTIEEYDYILKHLPEPERERELEREREHERERERRLEFEPKPEAKHKAKPHDEFMHRFGGNFRMHK